MTNFIVLGTINAITYKDIFPLIKEGKVKTGTVFNKTLQFKAPTGELKDIIGISWFTTFTVENKKPLLLTAKYNPEKYPKYDNYDAIEVSRVKDIPIDYDGVMGVPISFLDKYCSEQFEIVDAVNRYLDLDYFSVNKDIANRHSHGCNVNGKAVYKRILIRKVKERKKFIIVGNHSAITYKEIFPYLKDNKMWLGYKPLGGEMYFHITDEYKEEIVKTKKEGTGWVEIDGEVMARVTQACWFTNLEHSKRRAFVGLTRKYNPTDYPKYDNYDAIEVGRVEDIPKDYDGVMGVPISFLGKYNPNQFEIVGGSANGQVSDEYKIGDFSVYNNPILGGKKVYQRLFIRKVKERKKFIIVGNHSAISYKEIFPYIKNNEMWLGYKPLGGAMYFHITDEYKEEIVKTKKEGTGWVEVNGEIMANVSQACWFTNLEHSKRKAFIGLTRKYNPTDYPKYDNYDAISVKFVNDIPKDYYGLMGVPISFLGKYNPNQFEIVQLCASHGKTPKGIENESCCLNGKWQYPKLLIKRITEPPTEEEVKNIAE